jgi:NO-binding membrane sensor protein with MHYT domain/serine phosphatase RsbU (regulator of sigma subunit)
MRFVLGPAGLEREALQHSYDYGLVALSVVIATVAAYITVLLIARLRNTASTYLRRSLMIASAVTLGGGTWSMHFVGMLAYRLPVAMTYDPVLTAVSLLVPVVFVGYAIFRIRGGLISVANLLTTSTFLGIGIAGMHYTGMAAMKMPAEAWYRAELVAASVFIAMGASFAALWIALRFSDEASCDGLTVRRTGIAVVMGSAISGMHYTAMAAVSFLPVGRGMGSQTFVLDSQLMAFAITLLMLLIFTSSLLIASSDERLSARKRLGLLTILMGAIAVSVGGISMMVLYDASFRENQDRVSAIAKDRADIISSAAQFDAGSSDYAIGDKSGALVATLEQIRGAREQRADSGESVDFNIGRLQGGELEYLFAWRGSENWTGSLLESQFVGPMINALAGNSGSMIIHDHRGDRVLVAFEPVHFSDLGVVSKMDLAEIRAPFLRASLLAALGALVLIAIGGGIAYGIGTPMVRQLEEKQRLEMELEFAKSVQAGLLPDAPPERAGFQFAAKTISARFVGGDFYDFIKIDDERLGIIIGDVSGKGVSAALYMAQLLAQFRYLCKLYPEPDSAMTKMNELRVEQSRQGMFASAIYLLLDMGKREMRVANAGHHELVVRDGDSVVAKGAADGPPLGVVEGQVYGAETIALTPGMRVLLFTDGVSEARNSKREEYGRERLEHLLADTGCSVNDLIARVESEVRGFTGQAMLFDDMTMVVFGMD